MERKDIETYLGQINYCYRKGTPLIVYLNGYGDFDTGQSFSKIIDYLPETYGVFAPDYLNSGYSGASITNYTIANEASELAKIINSFKAKRVIIVAHSIGGIYALHMQGEISNLQAFVGIEPTTQEVILNPPKNEEYAKNNKSADKVKQLILKNLKKNFSEKQNQIFWYAAEQNAEKFNDEANQNATEALEKDDFWKSNLKMKDDIPTAIITEAYRQDEYQRSEYLSDNPKSKIYPLGSFHYIHFEYPKEVAEIINKMVS